jgi:hypothetical protein
LIAHYLFRRVKAAVLKEMLLEVKSHTRVTSEDETLTVGSDMATEPESDKNAGIQGGRPVFTITPVTNQGYTDVSPAVSAADIVIGLQGSDATPKLQMNGMRSRDSRESLIPEEHKERWYTILMQVCIPFLIAGLGMVGAGLILDVVKVSASLHLSTLSKDKVPVLPPRVSTLTCS